MLVRKAYKFRLNTNTETAQLIMQYAGNCRFLWNKALAMNLFRLENKQPILYYNELDWFSKLWKKRVRSFIFKTFSCTNTATNIKAA